MRIKYGTSSGNLNGTAYYNDGGLNAGSGSWSVDVASLDPGTTYYYRAVIQVGSKDYYGEVKSFKTASATQVTFPADWLELPATVSGNSIYSGWFGSGDSRSYSYQYDASTYSCVWTAYPLKKEHTEGSANTSSWKFNPDVPEYAQIDVRSSSYNSLYGVTQYSRGHLCPSADRKCDNTMRAPLYYVTNQVPQIQNGFNGGIWSSLENAIRDEAGKTDVVYVVTGVAYNKVGESRTVNYLTSDNAHPSRVPIANYFWKAVLKVKRDASGNVTSASAVGFWFEHKTYSGTNYASYAVSVDQLETWTGLDLFHNLPDSIESTCETNTSWSSFQNF